MPVGCYFEHYHHVGIIAKTPLVVVIVSAFESSWLDWTTRATSLVAGSPGKE